MKKLDKPIINFKVSNETMRALADSAGQQFIRDIRKELDNKAYVFFSTADMQVYGTDSKQIDVDNTSVSELFRILDQIDSKDKDKKSKVKGK